LPLLPSDGRVIVGTGVGSAEALGDWMAQSDAAPPAAHLVQLDELCTLLVRGGWQGSGLLPFLVECFDCPAVYDIPFRKQPVHVVEPTTILHAGTTPEWFWKNMQERDFPGGFGNRLFFGTGPKKPPIALPPRPDETLLGLVRDALDGMDRYTGELSLAGEAAALWDEFYARWMASVGAFDELTGAATRRVPAYAMKLAIAYAAVEGTGPTITAEQLAAAVAVAEWGAQCAERLIQQHRAQSTAARCEALVLDVLRDGALPPWKIHRRIGGRFSADELQKGGDRPGAHRRRGRSRDNGARSPPACLRLGRRKTREA